jgi:hypothetical protein
MCRQGANAGLLRGDVQLTTTASQDGSNNSINNNNHTSSNNSNNEKKDLWMKTEKASRISMDLSKSWKSFEVQVDAYGSIIDSTGATSVNGGNAIGANYGVFNSLTAAASCLTTQGDGDDAKAVKNAFQQRVIPMASRHVYIPKNSGNHVPLAKKDEPQKQSLWRVWSWSS